MDNSKLSLLNSNAVLTYLPFLALALTYSPTHSAPIPTSRVPEFCPSGFSQPRPSQHTHHQTPSSLSFPLCDSRTLWVARAGPRLKLCSPITKVSRVDYSTVPASRLESSPNPPSHPSFRFTSTSGRLTVASGLAAHVCFLPEIRFALVSTVTTGANHRVVQWVTRPISSHLLIICTSRPSWSPRVESVDG